MKRNEQHSDRTNDRPFVISHSQTPSGRLRTYVWGATVTPVVFALILVACGGRATALPPRTEWVSAENSIAGRELSVDDINNLETARKKACSLDRDAFKFFVAQSEDAHRPENYVLAIKYFCPKRADEAAAVTALAPRDG